MLKLNLILILYFSVVVLLQINSSEAESSKNSLLRILSHQDPRIINGTEASLNATRHQVSVRRRRNDGYFFGTGHICGGSLISENVVLSAAHCFVDYSLPEPNGTFASDEDFIVVMGNLDRYEHNNNTFVFDIRKIVKRVEIFNLKTYDDDIVLIMLDGKVSTKHPTVRTIILNDGPLKNNTICQATGWGITEDGYATDILRTVDLPIIDFDDCRKKGLYGKILHVGMVCVGYLEGVKDTCNGDSGGPLVCRGLQAGIISWGSACAEALQPGVITDVAYYKDWILKEVARHNGTLPKFAGISGGGNNNGDGTNNGDGGNNDNGGNNDGSDKNGGDKNDVGGNSVGGGDGVSSLRRSVLFVSLMLLFIF